MSRYIPRPPCENCGKPTNRLHGRAGHKIRFCSLECAGEGHFNGHWKGGRKIDNFGYVLVWVPKEERYGRVDCYIREHRYKMERHLGRKLEFNEIVHHKNHNIKDNRFCNLEVISRSKHSSFHNSKHGRKIARKHGVFLSLRQNQSKIYKK